MQNKKVAGTASEGVYDARLGKLSELVNPSFVSAVWVDSSFFNTSFNHPPLSSKVPNRRPLAC